MFTFVYKPVQGMCFKIQVLLLFRCGEASKSRDNRHCLRDFVTVTDRKRKGHSRPRRAMCGSTRVSQEAERMGGKCGEEPLLWFPLGEMGRTG